MRYFKYIAILAVLFAAASCSETELAEESIHSNQIQIVGRVTPFTDCNVSSRAVKEGDETNIANMSLAVFDTNDTCVNFLGQENSVFKLDISNVQSGYDLYLFANVEFPDDITEGSALNDFLAHAIPVSGIDLPKINGIKCLPMMGKVENFNPNMISGGIVEIPLTALYAKIVMNIEVRPDQAIENQAPAYFRIDGYEVHHVAGSVDFTEGTAGTTNDPTAVYEDVFEGSATGMAQGSTKISFSFYLPERYLQPATSAADYPYPFKGTFDTTTDKDQNGFRDEDENYRQRFKPCLVEGQSPAATFVRFMGVYSDHQGHQYDVSYDIYVGSDNYSNFEIVRNTQYNNNITIRGLANSNDQVVVGEGKKDPISIDHRVDVERVNPIVINLRRETLLDSHFEVRPLRIRKNVDFTGDVSNAKVKVEVLDNTQDSWIRLEHNNGTGSNTATHCANGKRLYFTTDLVTSTLSGNYSVEVPVSNSNETVWIYVDECEDDEAADEVRSATIRVSYAADGTNYTDPVDYVINQRQLFPVSYTDTDGTTTRKYNIEYHEEYLYNYDAEDEYGQTEYEGMAWGLNGSQLSYKVEALMFAGGSWNWITRIVNYIKDQLVSPMYDFYIPKHDTEIPDDITKRAYSGYTFCEEIIYNLNNRDNDESNNIGVLTLNEKPQSAIEYCFNKNKRNENGTITNVEWYLPAIDEIEDVVMSDYTTVNGTEKTYSRFEEFQNKFYWSSQPSYIRNYAYYTGALGFISRIGSYYYDDVNYARATKVDYSTENGYNNVPSGTIGYFEALIISGIFSPEYEYIDSGTYNGITLGSINRQEGNLSRTQKARIRCVKKISTSNASE